MNSMLQNTLGVFACTDADGNTHCWLSLACYTPHGCFYHSKHHQKIITDSGDTFHIHTNI